VRGEDKWTLVNKSLSQYEPISKSQFLVIGSVVVIPAQAGIQLFRAFLDARFRGHDGIIMRNTF
jgi:hypothetical protein